MSLSEFVTKEVKRIEADMHKIAHTALLGTAGTDYEAFLIAAGKYRQLKAERDRWIERRRVGREQEESTMDDMPDDGEDELPPAREQRQPRRAPARNWGGV
jgi:hypothetical protein